LVPGLPVGTVNISGTLLSVTGPTTIEGTTIHGDGGTIGVGSSKILTLYCDSLSRTTTISRHTLSAVDISGTVLITGPTTIQSTTINAGPPSIIGVCSSQPRPLLSAIIPCTTLSRSLVPGLPVGTVNISGTLLSVTGPTTIEGTTIHGDGGTIGVGSS